MPEKRNRIFIFEPCLGKMTGHWESNCRRFSHEFHKRNIDTSIFCHVDPDTNRISGLDVIPIFTANPFNDISSSEAFRTEYTKFKNDLSKIDKSIFTANDILLFPTILPHTHKAVMEWLAPIIKPEGPKAIFIFMIAAGSFQANCNSIVYRMLTELTRFKSIQNMFLKRLYQWGTSNYIDHYQSYIHHFKNQNEQNGYFYFGGCAEFTMNFASIFGLNVRNLPFPTILSDIPVFSNQRENRVIKIGYFGHSSLEKGGQFLEKIVKDTLAKHDNVEFVLHINPNIHTEKILAVFQQPMPRVTCYHGHISYDKIVELMHSVNINLLSYCPVKYAGLPSMVFTEAVNAKNVLVVPNYTWLSREAAKINAGYTSFNKYTLPGISKALELAITNFENLRLKTDKAKTRFLQEHNINNYLDQILEAVSG